MKLRTYAHFLWHALRLRWDRNHRVPLTVNIQITLACNNNCLYCAYDRNEPQEMTLPRLREIFADIRRLGGRRINLTGGEPLLRDDLGEIVRAAKDLDLFVGISTNGHRAAKQLPALRMVDQIMLSFDGPDEVRARLCGEQSAAESRQAVELFHEHGLPFWTTTVINRANLAHLEWIVEHARRHNSLANFVLLHTQPAIGVQFHPTLDQVTELLPSEEEIRDALRRLLDMKRAGAAIGSSLPYLEELLAWPDYREICHPQRARRYTCLAGRASCELMANGLLFPCGWMRAYQPGVSVLDEGFAAAFTNLPHKLPCLSCASSCWLESNLIFNLDPRTVGNWLRILLREQWRRPHKTIQKR